MAGLGRELGQNTEQVQKNTEKEKYKHYRAKGTTTTGIWHKIIPWTAKKTQQIEREKHEEQVMAIINQLREN